MSLTHKSHFFIYFILVLAFSFLLTRFIVASTTIGDNITTDGNLTVSGNTSLVNATSTNSYTSGTFTVGGNATTTSAGSLSIKGALNVNGLNISLYSGTNYIFGGGRILMDTTNGAMELNSGNSTINVIGEMVFNNGFTVDTGNAVFQGGTTMTTATSTHATSTNSYVSNTLTVGGNATTTSAGNIATRGTLTVGNGGAAISLHNSQSVSIDFDSVNQSCSSKDTSISASAGDIIIATPPDGQDSSVVWSSFVAANTVWVRLCKITTGALDLGSATWRIDMWRH